MSKLLLDQQPLMVMPKLAAKIGLNEAMILQQIHYWNEINQKANNNFKEGYYWTYNTVKEWQDQFPFWSTSTINRAITNLEKMRLVISGNFNKLKIDRTKWYRIDYEVLETLENSSFSQIDKSNLSEWIIHLSKMNKPLPEINSKNNSERKNKKGTKQGSVLSYSFQDYIDQFQIEAAVIEAIECYLHLYKQYRSKEHPKLKKEQWDSVVNNLFYVYSDVNGVVFDLDENAMMDMMEKHFKTKYKNCDYNILHFMSDGVRVRRMFEVAY